MPIGNIFPTRQIHFKSKWEKSQVKAARKVPEKKKKRRRRVKGLVGYGRLVLPEIKT